MATTHVLKSPVSPGPDELVPSRYALKVGAIDVMVVSDGVLTLPSAMLGHNADPGVRAAWLNDMFLPPDVLEWALNAVVVRSGGRTILIDAGIGMDPGLNLPRAGQLIHRLEAAGIDLSSVTDVVLTHMHMDHIGGLLVDGVKGRLRRDLRVHVAAAEAEFWGAPDFSRVSMPPGFPDALRRTAKRFLNEYRSQLRPFETEYEVAPIGDEQSPGGVHREPMRQPEIARGRSPLAPGLDERAVLGQLYDTRIGIFPVAIGDEDVAVRCDQHIGWPIESVGAIAGYAGLTQSHQ
jgi:hypothetical protein